MLSRFFWHEIHSSDPEATKAFLMALFPAWTHEQGQGPVGPYHMFSQGGQPWVGLMDHNPVFAPTPHIRPYVCVADIESARDQAVASGGSILFDIHDVPGQGRALVARDASGAVLSLMQSDHPQSADPRPRAHGQIIWNELATRDVAAAEQFYRAVCGWAFQRAPTDHEYHYLVDDGPHGTGGVLPMTGDQWGDLPSHWMTYFCVASMADAAGRVEELGGKVHVPAFDIANVGTIAVVEEPGGAVFTLMEPKDEAFS